VPPAGDTIIINTIDLYLKIWKNTPRSFYYSTLQNYSLPETAPQNHPLIMILISVSLITLVTFALMLKSKQQQIRRLMTQIKDQQHLLNKEEKKIRCYFESSPLGMFVADSRGRYTEVNPAACDITGYQPHELKKMTIA